MKAPKVLKKAKEKAKDFENTGTWKGDNYPRYYKKSEGKSS